MLVCDCDVDGLACKKKTKSILVEMGKLVENGKKNKWWRCEKSGKVTVWIEKRGSFGKLNYVGLCHDWCGINGVVLCKSWMFKIVFSKQQHDLKFTHEIEK